MSIVTVTSTYTPTPTATPTATTPIPTPSSIPQHMANKSAIIAGSVIGSVTLICIIVAVVIVVERRRRQRKASRMSMVSMEESAFGRPSMHDQDASGHSSRAPLLAQSERFTVATADEDSRSPLVMPTEGTDAPGYYHQARPSISSPRALQPAPRHAPTKISTTSLSRASTSRTATSADSASMYSQPSADLHTQLPFDDTRHDWDTEGIRPPSLRPSPHPTVLRAAHPDSSIPPRSPPLDEPFSPSRLGLDSSKPRIKTTLVRPMSSVPEASSPSTSSASSFTVRPRPAQSPPSAGFAQLTNAFRSSIRSIGTPSNGSLSASTQRYPSVATSSVTAGHSDHDSDELIAAENTLLAYPSKAERERVMASHDVLHQTRPAVFAADDTGSESPSTPRARLRDPHVERVRKEPRHHGVHDTSTSTRHRSTDTM
ncbi:hypothetical protein PLICRDRAFT_170113 [Plicaturopsis crispa FD-325 SS-3]|nr:hypothetical protein PLICRDRAFT_170113 [Plicaturopsis crispa FD-325 SS-3]